MAKRNNPLMFDEEIIDVPQIYNQRPEMMYISQPSQSYSRMAPNRSTMMSPYDNYDYTGYNYGFPNFNNPNISPNIVPTQARVPQAPPAGYRPGIDPEFNYFPNLNPPASTIGQYPYGINQPITPSVNIGGIGDLLGGINFGDTTAEGIDLSNIFQNQNMFQQPVIDYDLLASKINIPDFNQPQFQMPDFQMPDYTDQFQSLQEGLGGLRDQFTNFQMPTYQMPDYSGQFQGLQQGIGNLTDIFGNFQMPTYETPDYSQQFSDLSGQLSGLGTQLGGLQSLLQGLNMPQVDIDNIEYSVVPNGIRMIRMASLWNDVSEGNEQLIQATIMVIQGMAPDQATADAVINQFIGLYGQEAFMSLREQVLNPNGQVQTQGMIEGFGGGMDDFVQGVAGNQNRIAASPGEYIVPADVVSQLGDGNSEEGSRKLDGMLDRTRMAKTGTIKQAEPIDSKEVMPI